MTTRDPYHPLEVAKRKLEGLSDLALGISALATLIDKTSDEGIDDVCMRGIACLLERISLVIMVDGNSCSELIDKHPT